MTLFFEKKEADLSGKKNSRTGGGNGGRRPASTDRKGKGKVNGDHSETKTDETPGSTTEAGDAADSVKEQSPEAE